MLYLKLIQTGAVYFT